MGSAFTGFGVALVIVFIAGATLALCKRYCVGWQWGARNVWSICEEWRQRLSWLWAPREEKVGLVKAQHPTAQTVPGLYRHSSNTSQHLLHSDSDLRLDAQGAFTRFEAVDRDLHPPLGTSNAIPPQPLRPAPQPRPTARPRPTPLQTASTVEYLRMQESGPGPLTPPPTQQRAPAPSRLPGPSSVFHFQSEPMKNYGPFSVATEQTAFRFDMEATKAMSESIQMTPYTIQNNNVEGQTSRYEMNGIEDGRKKSFDSRCIPYRQFEFGNERGRYGGGQSKAEREEVINNFGFEAVQRSQPPRHHTRNESRGSQSSFGLNNTPNTTSQIIMESIYGPQTVSKMLQNSHNLPTALDQSNSEVQSIEMTPFKNSPHQEDLGSSYFFQGSPSKAQGLQRVSQYIQSLPDSPVYEPINDLPAYQEQMLYVDGTTGSISSPEVTSESASSSVPPPPAPPDPPTEVVKKEPTTGERIFSALRSVTSQSYIDASEFYNSILSSAQQVQRYTFSAPSLVNDDNRLQDVVQDIYTETDGETLGLDGFRRSSDLYSPELNLEAHRTAQEVYNSLQDPPASPLLLKDHDHNHDHNHESYTYLSDPSFTRTSEDIFNSLEQRRKSMERLNSIQDFIELDTVDPPRRRNSQELYAALEEVQLKRRLSQVSLEEAYVTSYTASEQSDSNPGSRRSSQGPEPEPPPDESNLKRAISCESVCSDTSVVLNDMEETPVVGLICVGLEHERWGGRGPDGEADLAVSVLEARDLVASDGQPAEDTFARVCLLPDRQTHMQTRLYRGSPSPSYQEKFLFPLDGGPAGRTLHVEVFSDESSMNGGASLIGEASLRLGPSLRPPATTWLPLTGPALPTPHLGELMFSLSYLPTAERLTLVVVKARNLRGANTVPGDFFVKVYLLQQGKKMHKKKTSVKKGEKSPIFNEAMIFNVPAHTLQNIQLRLTVAEVSSESGTNSKSYSVGHAIVGSSTSGRALAHWRQMLAALRRPVAMWHPLRK